MNQLINNGVRCDGFKDVPFDCSNPIQEKWIHVEAVKKTGDSDEEFVIVHTPKCIERIDINKRIHEEAKGTDLKSLIQQVIRTGDVSLLNQREGQFVDISGYPENTMDAMNNLVRGNDILGQLPDGLKDMKLEDLINMSAEDVGAFVKDSINKAIAAKAPKDADVVEEKTPTPVVEEKGDK